MRTWLAGRGFDPQFGARPMGRLIQQSVKKPLAERILFGDLAEGGTVEVRVKQAEDSKELELVKT